MNEVRPSTKEDHALPDEIEHISEGLVPLSRILTRLAQVTHNALQEKIAELGQMPLPAPDGSSSPENLAKKLALLNFAHDSHTKWVKALVIADWSRKVNQVRKVIDLKNYLDKKRMNYDNALEALMLVKRDLTFARMPSPDFKTALQVLSTGQGSWMPDMHYIEPPALARQEQLRWIGELNTLLSLRLNLEDFDSIPSAFRDYKIDSGRVTFKVAREFEVDLTIADEDVSKQFWFIDFRFAFSPAAATLPDSLRGYLESCVNEALHQEGLVGCYQFLHEFVLTHKINELKRQALVLNRSSWANNLKVEPLHRALAIQYWTNRGPSGSPKNWVTVAVESGTEAATGAKTSSSLVAKWYRENKEVQGASVSLDDGEISAEGLLRDIISLHVEHILTAIHDKLTATSRFKHKEASLTLQISRSDPAASSLRMQVTHNIVATLLVEPSTGLFSVKPHSRFTLQHEYQLNNSSGQAQDGVNCLEGMRCALIEDDINRKGSHMGWSVQKAPLTNEQLRSVSGLRDWTRAICLQRDGWERHWFIVVFLSLGGDVWWLVEGEQQTPTRSTRFHVQLPIQGPLKMSDAFWDNLTLSATGMIAQATDLADLHRRGIKSRVNEEASSALSRSIKLPAVEIALSALFPSMVVNGGKSPVGGYDHPDADGLQSLLHPNATFLSNPNRPWASDLVTVRFSSLEAGNERAETSSEEDMPRHMLRVSEAVIRAEKPARFASLKATTDRDVSFRPKNGEFKLRLRHPVGQPILPVLRSRIKTVDRFVNFLEAVDNGKGGISRGEVSLKTASCLYPDGQPEGDAKAEEPAKRWEIWLQLATDDITVTLEKENPHLRVIDLLQKLVNTDGGIWSLMTWLPTSIAAMSAIKDIETRWAELESSSKGHVRIFAKTLDWLSMSFTITPANRPRRTVNFDLRVKSRKGQAVWHIERLDTDLGKDDPFGPALQKVWDFKGREWLGLGRSAAGKPDTGAALMLAAVDEAIREVLKAAPTAPVEAPAKAQKTQPKSSNVVVLD